MYTQNYHNIVNLYSDIRVKKKKESTKNLIAKYVASPMLVISEDVKDFVPVKK